MGAYYAPARFRAADSRPYGSISFYEVIVMTIRPADEQDLPEILALYAEPDMDVGETLPLSDAAAIFRKMASYPDYNVYVAEEDGEIIGTFALAIMDNLAHMGKKSGLIEDVVVSRDHRRQSVGKRMMEYAVELCKEKSCYKVALSSNIKRESAHEFYKSLEFKIHGYSFLIELD